MLIKKTNLLLLTFFSIFFLYMFMNKTIFSETLVWTWWSYSEWLINYPEKFVRRGLIGDLLIYLSNGESNYNTIQYLVFANFILFYFLLLFAFIKFRLDFSKFLLLAFSPFGVYSFILYDNIYHRKEILIFNLFLIFIILNTQEKSFKFNSIYLYLFTTISLLIHEGVSLILVPFLFFIYRNEASKKDNSNKYLYYYLIFLLILFTILIFNSGNMDTALKVWNELPVTDRNIINNNHPPNSEYGEMNAIAFISRSLKDQASDIINIFFSGTMTLWIFFIFFGYFIINKIFIDSTSNLDIYNIFYKNPYLFLGLVVFFLGIDWGRWIVIYFYLIFFTLLYLKKFDSNQFSLFSYKNLTFLLISLFTVLPEYNISSNNFLIFQNLKDNIFLFILS